MPTGQQTTSAKHRAGLAPWACMACVPAPLEHGRPGPRLHPTLPHADGPSSRPFVTCFIPRATIGVHRHTGHRAMHTALPRTSTALRTFVCHVQVAYKDKLGLRMCHSMEWSCAAAHESLDFLCTARDVLMRRNIHRGAHLPGAGQALRAEGVVAPHAHGPVSAGCQQVWPRTQRSGATC